MRAVYAFSGDPITLGHIDIIDRASKMFKVLVVAIGQNPKKNYTFTLEERLDMAKNALKGRRNVTVTSFQGLLVDFAYENGISAIVRGIRGPQDFDYESELYHVNASQKLDIDTVFLPARQDLTHISSTTAKALQLEKGLIHEYVPVYVKRKLEERISEQYIVGITGEIASGKSYLGEKLEKAPFDIPVHNVDLDAIGHDLLWNRASYLACRVISAIEEEFGEDVMEFETVNRQKLGEVVFNDPSKMEKLNRIMKEPILLRLRKAIYAKKGLILINAALIAEMDIGYLCNHNVILVKSHKLDQKERLIQRGLSEEQIERRIASQFDFRQKYGLLLEKGGRVWVTNSDDEDIYQELKEYFGW